MTYTGNDHSKQARSYSASAAAATRRAERAASQAAEAYATAAEARSYGAWVTQRPSLWQHGCTPAELERRAWTWARIGDTYLRRSFSATESAAHYRGLAAQYRELAARRAASMAQLDADLAAREVCEACGDPAERVTARTADDLPLCAGCAEHERSKGEALTAADGFTPGARVASVHTGAQATVTARSADGWSVELVTDSGAPFGIHGGPGREVRAGLAPVHADLGGAAYVRVGDGRRYLAPFGSCPGTCPDAGAGFYCAGACVSAPAPAPAYPAVSWL